MMDQMIINLNGMSEEKLDNLFQMFRSVMTNCHEILGEYSFCKTGYNKINKSLFTGWSVVLANAESDTVVLREKKEMLRSVYIGYLKKDSEFYRAITSSTGTRKNILISIEVIRKLWENGYGKVNSNEKF